MNIKRKTLLVAVGFVFLGGLRIQAQPYAPGCQMEDSSLLDFKDRQYILLGCFFSR